MRIKAPFKVTFVWPFGARWPFYVTQVWQRWGAFTTLHTHLGPVNSKGIP